MPTYSIAQVITTAVITFLFSGIGGALLARYLTRAKPVISITSLGFYGDVVHLTDDAIEASESDDWGPGLKGFVTYKTACDRENKSSKLILELQRVKKIVDEWLNSNANDNTVNVLSKNDLRRCPYFSYVHIGSSILGKMRRRSLNNLPTSLQELSAMSSKFDLEQDDNSWILHLGSQGVRFPVVDTFSIKEKHQQEQIAKSFSCGELKNIRFVLETFSLDTANEINKLMRLRDELRKCICEEAHVAFDVVVTNLGDKPTVIAPYCSASLGLGGNTVPLLLRVANERTQSDSVETKNSLTALFAQHDEPKSEFGEMFDVEPYLAEVSSSPHISVAGGSTAKMTLISIDPMGKTGETLVKHFELGTLTCSLTAKTMLGKEVKTKSATFGKKLSDKQKQELLGPT